MDFTHFIAIDWSIKNMAIAKGTRVSSKINVIDVPTSIDYLKEYLTKIKGKVLLIIEESTTSQWLYIELSNLVDKVLVCDPYRNKLLSEGAKNDKIDAIKLVQLGKADLLKEVYHSGEEFIHLRKLVSSYQDLVRSIVRIKNQKSALFRSNNQNYKSEVLQAQPIDHFIVNSIDQQLDILELEKKKYIQKFEELKKKHHQIESVSTIPGIGTIGAVKIVSRVVNAKRFKKRNNFHSYCGLVKHQRISGGKVYGKRNPRYCRVMKSVIKSAVIATIYKENQFSERYKYLINQKQYSNQDARNAVARFIASTALGVLKSGHKYVEQNLTQI